MKLRISYILTFCLAAYPYPTAESTSYSIYSTDVEVPSICKSDCARQYQLLNDLDQYTPRSKVEEAFGKPHKEARNAKFVVDLYRGVYADVYLLASRRDEEILARAVMVRDTGRDDGLSKLTQAPQQYNKFLSEISLSEILASDCIGKLEKIEVKSELAWTPPCKLGKYGGYKLHSFLFPFGAADCGDYENAEFNTLICKKSTETYALGAMVTTADEDTSSTELFATLSDFTLDGYLQK